MIARPGAIDRKVLLQRVQPGLDGLMDGSQSPPFFRGPRDRAPRDLTGRGNPMVRGAITGDGTFVGGVFHTLPLLIRD
jgi:hypothetical protein